MELERMLRKTSTLAAVPSVAVLISFVLFSEQIFGGVYGSYYQEGAAILAVLSFGQLANVITGSCGYLLIITGHCKTMMAISLVTAPLALVTGIFMVKHYGALGLARAYAVALVIQQVLMLVEAQSVCAESGLILT